MTTALLVRHGQTTWNRDRRIQGWAPTGLTDRGRHQAEVTGSTLSTDYAIDRVIASDLRRCQETVDALTTPLDIPITYDARWRERDFGICQGLTYDHFNQEFPEYSVEQVGSAAIDERPESGESLRDMRDRVVAGWEDLVTAAEPNETVLVVTHGGPLYSLLGHITDRNLVSAIMDYTQDNCAVNEVRVDKDPPDLVRENTTVYEDSA